MLNVLGKRFFSLFLISQLLITALYSNPVEAAPRCRIRTLVERSEEASANEFSIGTIKGVDKIKLKAGTIAKIKKVFDDRDFILQTNKIKEIIEGAAELIKDNSRTPSVQRSNKMAEMGRDILKAVKPDLNDAQVKMVTFMIVEAVSRLEAIKVSEFKPATGRAELPVFKKKSTMHINKFHKLTESYVDGSAMYRDLAQDGGFLQWVEIRGLYANNSWAIGLRDHDMYHVHYSYGHPYYLAVNFMTARSINDRRYLMVSSFWEAVDTFRTTYEDSISNYFKRKRMTAEEGMLFLGSATEKELDEIDRAIGTTDSVDSRGQLSYGGGWRPTKTKFGRDTTNYYEQTFLNEINDFINISLEKLKDSANKKYYNYHRRGPGVSGARDESAIP